MLTLASPGKINLFLRVLRRREDGFHEIASLFQAISLVDTLQFSRSNKDQLTCSDNRLPLDDSNLVWKAVKLFRKKSGLFFPVSIHLEKKIPWQAGLGGGSSNAATTLWGLNELANKPHSEEELRTWSGEIGSDISFFFSSGTAYCTGRGEKVASLAPLSGKKFWLVVPNFGCNTPKVYAALDVNSLVNRDPEQLVEEFLDGKEPFLNDLEKAACQVSPKLTQFRESLIKCGFSQVVLTGSGSGFFCFGKNSSFPKDSSSFSVAYCSRKKGQWYGG